MPEKGIGYYPVEAGVEPYDTAYIEKYREMACTFVGRQISHARVDFVARHHHGLVADIGIGCGQFMEFRNSKNFMENTFGFDVNPAAVELLRKRKLFFDPYKHQIPAITLWDVFEHIPDYAPLLANVSEWVFMSLPIFTGPDHVLRSKHYRKDEHCWYFTVNGLITEMARHGFALAEHNRDEEKLGREDIGSFAFRRVRS